MRTRNYLSGLAVVLLLAGCGDSDDSTTTTTTAAASTSTSAASTTASTAATTTTTAAFTGTPAAGVDVKHLCTVLTGADFNKVLNAAITVTNAPTDENGCTYYTEAGRKDGKSQGSLDVKLSGAKADWEPNNSGIPVAGAGEAAFKSQSGEFTRVEALKGDTEVEVGVGNGVTATDDQFKALINLAFQRLGV